MRLINPNPRTKKPNLIQRNRITIKNAARRRNELHVAPLWLLEDGIDQPLYKCISLRAIIDIHTL